MILSDSGLLEGRATSERPFMMDYQGKLLVEITGIPLELLGSLWIVPVGDGVGLVEEGGAGGDEGEDTPTATRRARDVGGTPSIQLMHRIVIGGPKVDWREKTLRVCPGPEDRPRMATPDPVPRQRPLRYERRAPTISWNQHCCGANAVRTRPFAAPGIVNSRSRHPTDLEPDMIKIR